VDAAAANNPILQGVEKSFHVRSWLYNVLPQYPAAGAVVLLRGQAINPNKPMSDNPVAWTWSTAQGARSFYTSLGHPEDFQVESVQRLLVNAIHWAAGKQPPARWNGKLDIQVRYHGIRPAPKPASPRKP
jgi:type 1 glutamine amidotransferase